MANYTPNLNLRKPLTTEKYDMVADLNDTKDKIDTHAGAVKSVMDYMKKHINVEANEPVTGNHLLHVYANAGSPSRAIEIHNRSGVNSGNPTGIINAKESLVIHHYNDNNPIQIDNVGRDNVMMTFKQGDNPVMAGHSEVGRGSYINFDRSGADLPTPIVVEHLGRISPEDWFDVGNLAVKGTWGLTLVGKRNSVNKVQTTLPLLIYSKGLNTDYKGADALRIHSTDYGGRGLVITNRPTSHGTLLDLEGFGTTGGQALLNIKVRGGNSGINIYNGGFMNAMLFFSRQNNIFGDLIRATNEAGTQIFKIEGDGKSISLTDSVTGALKKITISNGEVVVV